MNKNLPICLLIAVGLKFLSAQNVDFEVRYHDNTIYLQQGFFGMKYVKGEQSYPLSGLRVELSRYPESKELYEKHLFVRVLSVGVLLAGPILGATLMEKDPTSFVTVYFGSIILGVFSSIESYNKLNKAVWAYNRESLNDGS